jgi:hypothetical protein
MKNKTNRLSFAAIIAVTLLAMAPAGRAAVVEGFESGTTGTNIGDVSNRTPTYGPAVPQEGNRMLLLTTINTSLDAGTQQSGTGADTAANQATFAGTAIGNLRNTKAGQLPSATARDGSAFKLVLGALNVGDQITFNYNFLTSDSNDTTNDFAYYALNGNVGNPSFADTANATLVFGGGTPFNLQSGWGTVTIDIATATNYTLVIGVADAANSAGASGLLIDNISVAPIPEPSTFGLIVAGAISFAAVRRRMKK